MSFCNGYWVQSNYLVAKFIMLRIKEEFNLEEILIPYGFKLKKRLNQYERKFNSGVSIIVNVSDRQIYYCQTCDTGFVEGKEEDLMYELTSLGYLEKC